MLAPNILTVSALPPTIPLPDEFLNSALVWVAISSPLAADPHSLLILHHVSTLCLVRTDSVASSQLFIVCACIQAVYCVCVCVCVCVHACMCVCLCLCLCLSLCVCVLHLRTPALSPLPGTPYYDFLMMALACLYVVSD